MTTKRERPPAGGYTLIELASVVCIVGILVAAAIPSLGTLARDGRRTAVVNDLVATLLVARSEALKRGGRPLVICGVADRDGDGDVRPDEQSCAGHDWTDGWALGTWDDANGNWTVDAPEFRPLRLFSVDTGGQMTVTAGNFTASPPVGPAGTILFKAFGRRTSNGTITVCDDRGPAAARGVIVSSVGRARVSSTRADGGPLRCP